MNAAERDMTTWSSALPGGSEQHLEDEDPSAGRQCVLYYTNSDGRYYKAKPTYIKVNQGHRVNLRHFVTKTGGSSPTKESFGDA